MMQIWGADLYHTTGNPKKEQKKSCVKGNRFILKPKKILLNSKKLLLLNFASFVYLCSHTLAKRKGHNYAVRF
ncbi:hypothetical protein DC20_17595 [Rufibacter tibetensis]|uniref:Uncharacterized protein n=1 Tax=Rufibacter tibetensis TaxID=512763 RepID=A0A0P0CF16_9BACT|nr:hypothetical protein DC20_17595 [Rufibacter tibetensis]